MQNYDETELKKFSEIAHQWWDISGPCAPLHHINPLRLNFICQQIPLSGKKILDVGCGGGILTESLATKGADTTGIDMSYDLIQVAKLHLHQSKLAINYQQISVEECAQQHPQQFDIITCMELLEHVPDPKSIVAACTKLLKPTGHLFFSTINRNPKAYLEAIIGAEYLLQLLPKGTHNYAKFIKPSELSAWARANKLELMQMTGMSYNPLTKAYYLCANIDVNYIVYLRKP